MIRFQGSCRCYVTEALKTYLLRFITSLIYCVTNRTRISPAIIEQWSLVDWEVWVTSAECVIKNTGRVRSFNARNTGMTLSRLRQLNYAARSIGTSLAYEMAHFAQVRQCYSRAASAE